MEVEGTLWEWQLGFPASSTSLVHSLSPAAQGGLLALQKSSGQVFFAVKSRGFADIIFTLHGINSQPEKQRKTPH